MTTLLNNPVLFFLVYFIFLALVVQVGYQLRQAYPASTQDELHDQVHDARDGIIFLLSLLLGFTLAMALTRYDHRKQLLVDEADAIGTTALRARLLPEPYDSRQCCNYQIESAMMRFLSSIRLRGKGRTTLR